MKISNIHARELLDSRGNPTIEVDLELDNEFAGSAIVPSGASTGEHEAVELRDKDSMRFLGNGVLQAVKNVNTILAQALNGQSFDNQSELDSLLIDIDSTKFSWNEYANFKILDSLLYINNNNLVLDAKLIVDIINDKEIYKFLQTSKSLRPKLEKLELNFNYNFDQQIIDFNDIKINDQINENVNSAIKELILNRDKLQNKIYFKKLMKDFLVAYVG